MSPASVSSKGSQQDSQQDSQSPSHTSPSPSVASIKSVSTGSSQQNNKGSLLISSSSSVSTTSVPTGGGQQNSDRTKKPSLTVGAIVGCVIGGLVILAAVGVGTWAFLRSRKKSSGEEHSVYAVMDKYGMQPSNLRLYVKKFVPLSNLFSNRCW